MQLSKVITNEQGLPEVIDLVPPTGWTEEHIVASDNTDNELEREQLSNLINASLPQAAHKVEDLIYEMDYQLGIVVSSAYLTINPDGGYHVFLLVSQEDYHSTRIHAAHLLVEKYMEDTDIAIRFTFTIQRHHIISYMTGNRYKLKFVPEERRTA